MDIFDTPEFIAAHQARGGSPFRSLNRSQQANQYLLHTNHILAFYLAQQVTCRYLQNSDTATWIQQDPWEQVDPDLWVHDLQVFSDR